MNNKTGFNRLGRKPDHRKAMLRNLVMSLLKHEHITTTKAKARETCRMAEKMITRAKKGSLHDRRIVARDINDADLVKKLFAELATRYANRKGGYTRIIKLGFRDGDAAPMVILELVEREGGFGEAKLESKKPTKKVGSKIPAPKKEVKTEKKEAKPKAGKKETSPATEKAKTE